MPMPPQLAKALAAKKGGTPSGPSATSQLTSNKFENNFFKKKGTSNPDPKEKGGLPVGTKKKNKVSPSEKKAIQAAAARKMGMGG